MSSPRVAFRQLRDLPADRTSIGSAMVDTATQVASGVGTAAVGTILTAMFSGSITAAHWSSHQTSEFHHAITLSGWILSIASALLVGWGFLPPRMAGTASADAAVPDEG